MKKTPLYEKHLSLNGRIIDFGGWLLPVEYSGIIPEHEAVRTRAGLFDVSHMGELLVEGPGAEAYIQNMVTNDISSMRDLQIYYSPMCYPDGGIVDDLLIYRYHKTKYLLVVNASNTEKDLEWLQLHRSKEVTVKDVSGEYAQLALQGPLAQKILQELTDKDLEEIHFFCFSDPVRIGGIPVMISRNGYTGEDGFELFFSPEHAEAMWNKIMEAGAEVGILPAGLGARDTLRFEVGLPLYGHELSETISPLEADLGAFVKLDKEDFLGKEALRKQRESGVPRRLYALEMVDRGIPRAGFQVMMGEKEIGFVTTGSYSPTLKKNVALALLDASSSVGGPLEAGAQVEILIREKPLKAVIVEKPFYSKRYKKNTK